SSASRSRCAASVARSAARSAKTSTVSRPVCSSPTCSPPRSSSASSACGFTASGRDDRATPFYFRLMKLKTLLIVVGLLAVASLAVYFVNRPTAPTPADPRVGQPLLATDVLAQATRFTLSENGNTVELTKAGEGAWRVASYHDL